MDFDRLGTTGCHDVDGSMRPAGNACTHSLYLHNSSYAHSNTQTTHCPLGGAVTGGDIHFHAIHCTLLESWYILYYNNQNTSDRDLSLYCECFTTKGSIFWDVRLCYRLQGPMWNKKKHLKSFCKILCCGWKTEVNPCWFTQLILVNFNTDM